MTSKFSIDNRELLQRISSGEAVVGIDFGNLIVRELAAFRLAALDSEPVGEFYEDGPLNWYQISDGDRVPAHRRIPLYRHAQPVPVVSTDLLHTAASAIEDLLEHTDPNTSYYSAVWADVPGKLRAAMLAAAPQSPGSEPAPVPGKWIPVSEQKPDCWCLTCRPVVLNDMRFVVCPDCGNKRCPRANDHRNACTGSNEPGQEGGAYPDTPQEVKP
ncbi:TPA: hypothetical protein ACHV8R_001681 [Klebsiella pneumoniae]